MGENVRDRRMSQDKGPVVATHLDLTEDSKKAVEVDVKGRVVPGEMREVGRVKSGEKSVPI